jgi:uncharacterized protein
VHLPSFTIRAVRHLENALHIGGWVVRAARALGFRPRLKSTHLTFLGSGTYAGMPPLRIAYASDFHAGPTTDPEVIEHACAALLAAEPDVLLLGGDFVNFGPHEVDSLAKSLGTIPAPLGRFAVLGNHDWMADPRYITHQLELAGIEVLTNRNVRLPRPYEQVWICGLDDHWCGQPDAGSAFAGAKGFRIALMHAPSGVLDIGDNRFELALCGHTHGGQIALPGGKPLVLPAGALSRRYCRGRYDLTSGGTLVVSVGVGCALLPIRTHVDPEIVVCTVTWPREPDSTRGQDFVGAENSARGETNP